MSPKLVKAVSILTAPKIKNQTAMSVALLAFCSSDRPFWRFSLWNTSYFELRCFPLRGMPQRPDKRCQSCRKGVKITFEDPLARNILSRYRIGVDKYIVRTEYYFSILLSEVFIWRSDNSWVMVSVSKDYSFSPVSPRMPCFLQIFSLFIKGHGIIDRLPLP